MSNLQHHFVLLNTWCTYFGVVPLILYISLAVSQLGRSIFFSVYTCKLFTGWELEEYKKHNSKQISEVNTAVFYKSNVPNLFMADVQCGVTFWSFKSCKGSSRHILEKYLTSVNQKGSSPVGIYWGLLMRWKQMQKRSVMQDKQTTGTRICVFSDFAENPFRSDRPAL